MTQTKEFNNAIQMRQIRYSYKSKERTKTMNATTTTDKFAGHKYHEKKLNKLGIKINREKKDFCFELYKNGKLVESYRSYGFNQLWDPESKYGKDSEWAKQQKILGF